MKKPAHDRLGEIATFVQVAECNGFSSAAHLLGVSPSSISKLVARLEARLGVKLINRTTRKLSLTDEGEIYYKQALKILAEIDEAEQIISSKKNNLQGKVKITCSAPFAYHQIIPLLPELMDLHPHIKLEISCTDQVVDMLDERCDIAIRIGHLKSSNLTAIKLADTNRILVASALYLNANGKPTHPKDLYNYRCLNFHAHSVLNNWLFKKDQHEINYQAKGLFSADNGEALRAMVVNNGGIARLSSFIVQRDIIEGKLVPILEDWNPRELTPIYLVHTGQIAVRVRAVIDFLQKKLADVGIFKC